MDGLRPLVKARWIVLTSGGNLLALEGQRCGLECLFEVDNLPVQVVSGGFAVVNLCLLHLGRLKFIHFFVKNLICLPITDPGSTSCRLEVDPGASGPPRVSPQIQV